MITALPARRDPFGIDDEKKQWRREKVADLMH
jgi:hypothetical protein